MDEKHSPMSESRENTENTTLISNVAYAPQENIFDGGCRNDVLVDSEGLKRKRGRPRKFDSNGNLNPAYIASSERRSRLENQHQPFVTSIEGMFSWITGKNFTPYVMTIQLGEDVVTKLHMVSLNGLGPRSICVLSANGTISSVTIRQPGFSSELVTYEGLFEILSLSGTYTIFEANGLITRTGGLTVSLAGPDGRVIGGYVAGWLTAANPIQLVVGVFVPYAFTAPSVRKRKSHRGTTKQAELPNLPSAVPLANEVGPTEASPTPAQSHSEADNSIGIGHNLNVASSHNTPGEE